MDICKNWGNMKKSMFLNGIYRKEEIMKIQEYIQNLLAGKTQVKNENQSVEKMKIVMEKLGNPQSKLKYIHVTGTNGKGSVIEMLNNILINANLKVGKFISPHLVSYHERISINGEYIKDEEIQKIFEEVQLIIEKENIDLNFFEFFTLIAILYFCKQKVDIVLMEVGFGGLYDSTNIIFPIISVISSIGYDHMKVLGNTLEDIAKQKAGIIKENSETVYMEQKPNIDDIIEKNCKEKQNILHMVGQSEIKNQRFENDREIFDYKQYHDIEVNLKGKRQIQNAALVLECCDILNKNGYHLTEENIKNGLKTVIHKGRFEVIHQNPTMIFDGGHNEQAIENLKETIDLYYKNAKKIFVISVLKSKDYHKIIEDILDKENVYIFTNGNDKNLFTDKHFMYEYAKQRNDKAGIYEMDLKEAIQFCKEKRDFVSFIIGSFYIYDDVKRIC